MTKIATSSWHYNEEQIIKRMRKLCKLGVLIELPVFKGTAKAKFVDATALKPCSHWNGIQVGMPGSGYVKGFKVIIYTVSSGSGVIRTWIPVESERFQNDGAATEMNTGGKNHTPDRIEILIHRHKLTQVQTKETKELIAAYARRYKLMVLNGGWKPYKGAMLRLLTDNGVNVTPALREIFNEKHANGFGSGVSTGAAEVLDKAAFEALERMGNEGSLYPEYYCGYPTEPWVNPIKKF